MEFVKLVGPAGVFFIMFALGLNLTLRNFVKVFKSFENLIIGLICQIIILPVSYTHLTLPTKRIV